MTLARIVAEGGGVPEAGAETSGQSTAKLAPQPQEDFALGLVTAK
jgi:hypothetical protein